MGVDPSSSEHGVADDRPRKSEETRRASGLARRASRLLSRGIALTAATLTVLIVVSCSDHDDSDLRCDSVLLRCRTVCDYWCDGWGCFPSCYDQCWDECFVRAPQPPSIEAPASDATTTPPAEGGSQSGSGSLCSPCTSNGDCGSGALCILRGGPRVDASPPDGGAPASTGFCGQACLATVDCPQGFACMQIGSTKQCLRVSGTCD
jgi:hypothetical protein